MSDSSNHENLNILLEMDINKYNNMNLENSLINKSETY